MGQLLAMTIQVKKENLLKLQFQINSTNPELGTPFSRFLFCTLSDILQINFHDGLKNWLFPPPLRQWTEQSLSIDPHAELTGFTFHPVRISLQFFLCKIRRGRRQLKLSLYWNSSPTIVKADSAPKIGSAQNI